MGTKCFEFEHAFAQKFKKHAILVNSGSSRKSRDASDFN